ncbi:MAG: flagellar protein [Candidatus Raymondbacteria bacterium RifOxyA12_full_50_37]|uniref:Flagellar protein n=1 Tax=Candidatus Raymondbacteria bacterium RIFOXYD12_FULL_49_13 TaxID=1817890 RepID=A0A1F7F2K4_UNCRA|nr:MAG: flagellar protein [Candidatus Raymondbacteria bacterium RifOxyA12_full_50_37]OGJ85908.1 MAG: flagellar protein [Candidatus Raymondbacteria bacterium RIFOXYA2_FULL_49_16]OGJ91491.1 MAG: flagellar protein [Candidatus Raymondbacteria bacterium RifOxyB12_full_50_8]OGJ95902.1 MAG: flagellar protein [Candidatus Raymondbacteria bacterium RIFOXYC2_FULL_50_21]OGK00767.1 MAG: flagellar protein [Candidatus Raymondbacteria bacterium RIFOXYD12_FULL_49_13]OGP39754.1 MAG: flagellar protein [Candidatu
MEQNTLLAQRIGQARPLTFSSHAQTRLKSRGIDFSAELMDRLSGAVDRAATKGSRDSLVLMQDLALIVNIKNRTVITAMDGKSVKDNIFTNIDSAVIA